MNKGGSIAGYYVEICKFFKLHLKPLFLFEQGIFIQERKAYFHFSSLDLRQWGRN